jgi:hypothetical protein
MKKILFALIAVACILTLGAGNALATQGPYYKLTNYIVEKNWNPYTAIDQNAAFVRITPNGNAYQANVEIHNLLEEQPSRIANWKLGWYEACTSAPTASTRHQLTSDLTKENIPDDIDGSKPFGIYVEDDQGKCYYSQSMWNPLNSNNVHVIYCETYSVQPASQNRYIFGFDTDLKDNSLADSQRGYAFTDIVVDVQPITIAPIPEVPTVAVPVVCILGLLFVFGRKKEGL